MARVVVQVTGSQTDPLLHPMRTPEAAAPHASHGYRAMAGHVAEIETDQT